MANSTVYPYGTNGELPSSIGLINDLVTGGSDKALTAEQGKVLNKKISLVEKHLDVSQLLPIGGYIFTNGKFNVSDTYIGVVLSVSDLVGKTIILRNETEKLIRYAFITGLSTTENNFCPNSELISLPNSLGTTAIVPSGCIYLYIYQFNGATNLLPDYVSVLCKTEDTAEKIANIDHIAKKVGNENLPDYTVVSTIDISGILSGGGYILNDGTWHSSIGGTQYYGGFISGSAYRGKKIKVTSNENNDFIRIGFAAEDRSNSPSNKSTSYSILCRGTSLIANNDGYIIADVPMDCSYIYMMLVSNYKDVKPSKIEVITETPITKILKDNSEKNSSLLRENYDTARIFSYYFPGMTSSPTLSGLGDATITSSGLSLPVGMNYHICHQKVFVFDNEKISLEITATLSDKVLFYSAPASDGVPTNGQTESYILFDFTAGRVSIYQSETTNTSAGEGIELVGISFASSAGDYILTIGRKNRAPFAEIFNKSTLECRSVFVDEKESKDVNVAIRPAGWLYTYPAFSVLAGAPIFKRFTGAVPTDLFMLFQGDSYTQGYAGQYMDCWAKKASDYFGNSLTCGRSGGKLSHIIEQYHDSIKGNVKTKYMVISIGINDMSALSTDSLIESWAKTLSDYLDELVADGIVPIVNRIWPEGSSTSATAQKAEKMNNYIRSFGYDGADFGAVSGYSNNTDYYTSGHLSRLGNSLSYKIFIGELSNYFINK